MATKKTEIIEESPVPAAETAPAAADAIAADPEATPAAASRRKVPALAIAGIVVGAVIVAGGLFGGGVLVGANLPGEGQGQVQSGPRDGRFPPDGLPGDGTRPDMPGQGGTDPQGDTQSN